MSVRVSIHKPRSDQFWTVEGDTMPQALKAAKRIAHSMLLEMPEGAYVYVRGCLGELRAEHWLDRKTLKLTSRTTK